MIEDMIKLSVFLTIACVIAAGALSITYVATKDTIALQKKSELNLALSKECLPGSSSVKEEKDHFIGLDKKGGKIGYAFRVSPEGYGGAIDMLVGINMKGSVVGVKILSLNETPGLGMQAAEAKFLKQFVGKNAKSPLKAKKDIDAITGASITSQAVADGVKEALKRFRGLKL